MKRLHTLSPASLLSLTMLGSIAPWTMFLLRTPNFRHNMVFAVALFLLTFGIGYTLLFKSISAFKQGVLTDRWPAETLAPVKAALESPLATVFSFLSLGAFAYFSLVARHSLGHTLAWAFYMPTIAFNQLRFALRSQTKPRQPVDFNTFAPITSDHWGQR